MILNDLYDVYQTYFTQIFSSMWKIMFTIQWWITWKKTPVAQATEFYFKWQNVLRFIHYNDKDKGFKSINM